MKKSETQAADVQQPERFLDSYLPYWLTQASHAITREFHREVARAGLSNAEWRVLASLDGSAGETISSLCRLAVIKQPTLSKLVQRLENDGLVTRQTTEGDRRHTLVNSTAKGKARIDELAAKARAHQKKILQPFGAQNARKLMCTLQELVRQRESARLTECFQQPSLSSAPLLRPASLKQGRTVVDISAARTQRAAAKRAQGLAAAPGAGAKEGR